MENRFKMHSAVEIVDTVRQSKHYSQTVHQMAADLVKSIAALFALNAIHKWNFYAICEEVLKRRWLTYPQIAKASKIQKAVIQMRIHNLRAMR